MLFYGTYLTYYKKKVQAFYIQVKPKNEKGENLI